MPHGNSQLHSAISLAQIASIFSSNFLAGIGFRTQGGLHDKNEVVWFCSNISDFARDISARGANGFVPGLTPGNHSNPQATLLATGRRFAIGYATAQTD
jgi:hypothetical protein